MLLLLALYLIYSCKDIMLKIADAFPKLICFRTKDWAKLQKFVCYRISHVMQCCLRSNMYYDTSLYKADLIKPWQMEIRRKNGGMPKYFRYN